MAGILNTYGQKAVVETAIRNESDGYWIVLANSSGGTIDNGINFQRITEPNCQGEGTTALKYVADRDASLTLTMQRTPEAAFLATGKKPKAVASGTDEFTRNGFIVPADGIVSAKASGTFGFGIVANAVSEASWLNAAGISVPLVQDTNYASFNPSSGGNELKYAVGANGAMLFGSSLWNKAVTFKIPIPLTNYYDLGLAYGLLRANVMVAMINLQIWRWKFPSLSVEPGSISLTEPNQELKFSINGDYNLQLLGQTTPC